MSEKSPPRPLAYASRHHDATGFHLGSSGCSMISISLSACQPKIYFRDLGTATFFVSDTVASGRAQNVCLIVASRSLMILHGDRNNGVGGA